MAKLNVLLLLISLLLSPITCPSPKAKFILSWDQSPYNQETPLANFIIQDHEESTIYTVKSVIKLWLGKVAVRPVDPSEFQNKSLKFIFRSKSITLMNESTVQYPESCEMQKDTYICKVLLTTT
jgi:hypothetical protein